MVEVPVVSIIIPVYNAENTLGRCLDSAINQSFKNIEIVIVNDASTDKSQEIIDDYRSKDQRIKSIVHSKNMNAGGAYNTGIKNSRGTYILFLDNDDYLSLNCVEVLLQSSQNFTCDLVSGKWSTLYLNGRTKIVYNFPLEGSIEEKIKYTLVHGMRMMGMLIKRSIFIDNNLYFPEQVFYEDNAIAGCIQMYAKSIVSINATTYYYVITTSSVTQSTTIKKMSDRVFTTELFLNNLKNRHLYDSQYKSYFDVMYLRMCCNSIILLSKFRYLDIRELLSIVVAGIKVNRTKQAFNVLSKHNCFISFCPRISYWTLRMYRNLFK